MSDIQARRLKAAPRGLAEAGSESHDEPHGFCEAIAKAVATVARQYRLGSDDADELQSEVWVKVLTHRGQLLRRFRGDASLHTYLTTVARNLVLDRRNKEWGRWRASAMACRHGADAVALDRLVRRDGRSCDEAVELLCSSGGSRDARVLWRIAVNLPLRSGRRRITLTAVKNMPSPIPSRCSFEHARQQSRVKRAMLVSLQALADEDRDLIVRRFVDAMTVAEISSTVGEQANRMYRRLSEVLSRLRDLLLLQGVDASIVQSLLDDRETDLHLDLERLAPGVRVRLIQEAS